MIGMMNVIAYLSLSVARSDSELLSGPMAMQSWMMDVMEERNGNNRLIRFRVCARWPHGSRWPDSNSCIILCVRTSLLLEK